MPVERTDETFIENTKVPSFEIQHVMAQSEEVHDPPCAPNRNLHEQTNNQIPLNRRDINIGPNGQNIAQEAQIVTQPSVTNVTDMMNVTFAQVQYQPIQAIQSAVSLTCSGLGFKSLSLKTFFVQELRPVQMTGPQTSESETNLIPISVGQPIPQGKIILITKPT